MTQPLTFITGNMHKADQASKWLGLPLEHHKLDLDEIQSLDLHTVVEHKVRQAYSILKSPVMVEDVAMVLPAMGRLPGTFIKWFLEELGVDGLAKLAAGLESQKAYASICYGLYDGRELHFFDGVMHGQIAPAPRGSGGFGFDQVFINDGHSQTRSEMSEANYAQSSYRAEALKKLKEFLTKQA